MALHERLAKLERLVADRLGCQTCATVAIVVVRSGEDPTPQLPGPCSACGRERTVYVVTSPIPTRAAYLRRVGATACDEDGPPELPEIVVEDIGKVEDVRPLPPPEPRRPADGLPWPPRWVPRSEQRPDPEPTRGVHDPLAPEWR